MVRVSPAEFARISRDSRQKTADRKAKRKDNASFQASLMALARPETPRPASNACSTAKESQKRATVKPKPPKRISVKTQIKLIKKRILGNGGLWSQAVRKRDGHRCIMCAKTEGLQAHHWLFRRAHSTLTAVEISNGSTLCYGCHIGRIHKDGDGDFVLQLAAKMTEKVGADEIQRLRVMAGTSSNLGLDWWQEAERKIKAALGAAA